MVTRGPARSAFSHATLALVFAPSRAASAVSTLALATRACLRKASSFLLAATTSSAVAAISSPALNFAAAAVTLRLRARISFNLRLPFSPNLTGGLPCGKPSTG